MKLGEALNNQYKDNSGTHDVDKYYGVYQTNLPFPNLLEDKNVNWQSYFDQKDKIGGIFCKTLLKKKQKFFYKPLIPKYKQHCNK